MRSVRVEEQTRPTAVEGRAGSFWVGREMMFFLGVDP